jgi:DNA-binding MarR family transcriptional regulator
MDQVFFSVKRAHHATLRFSRKVLATCGLTPARFDFLRAVLQFGSCTQFELRQSLGLARSTISEMLATLERIGLIRRMRYRRTRLIFATDAGERIYQRVFDECLNPGWVALTVDAVLSRYDPEVDSLNERFTVQSVCNRLRRAFGDPVEQDLYGWWHPDEWLCAVGEVDPSRCDTARPEDVA